MAALSDGSLMAHWLEQLGEGTYAYGVRFALSTDAGVSWSAPRWLHEDRAEVEHGFCSLVALDDGRFGALWLDGRQTATGGPMALYWRTIARDGTLGEEECVDSRVCDCCQTTLALDASGAPLAAWRDRGDTQEQRDISWARRTHDGWSAPRPVHADGWIIEGCPVNGPRLVGGDSPAVAWYSGARGDTRVSFAALDAEGTSFAAPEQLIGAESFGRLDLVRLGGGDWLASWLEHDDGSQATWSLARFPTSAVVQTRAVVAHVPSARSSGSLRMARGTNEVLLAWTTPGPEAGISVATLELQSASTR